MSGWDMPVPPKLYDGVDRTAGHLCQQISNVNYKVNILAAKGSKIYTGKTLNYKNYRFGKSFLGRCLSWAEFQIQCIRLIKDVDIIQNFLPFPEHLTFLNKVNKPILHSHQNTGRPNTFIRMQKNNPYYSFLQCCSNDQMQKIIINDPTRVFLTYNCVDTNFFKPGNYKKENYLAYLGRLNFEKGIDIAVRLSLDSGIPLKIAGPIRPGEKGSKELYDEKVRPFLGEQIQHIGEINDEEKIPFISKAKALLFPNRWDEPFGIMNIEALACDISLIATNRGILREIVKNHQTGILFNNYEELRDAVKNVDYLDIDKFRNDALERFSTAKYLQDTLKIHKKY